MSDQDNPLDSAIRVVPGSYEDALAHGEALLGDHPEAALRQAETILRGGAEPRALRLAAAALRGLGRNDDAERAELAAIQEGFKDPALEAIAVATADGRNAEAVDQTRNLLKRNGDDLLAMTLGAEAAIASWNLQLAEAWLRDVQDRAPSYLRASMLLATCLSKQIRMREAISVLEEVVARKPDNTQALTFLAKLTAEVRENEDAVRLHERLTVLDGDRPERWINLAQHYRIAGKSEQAVAAFRRALEIKPDNGAAWWSLANYFQSSLTEADVAKIRAAAGELKGKPKAGAMLLALGLLEEAAGNHEAAFSDFVAGKRIRLDEQPYDPQPVSDAVDQVIHTFDKAFIGRHGDTGFADNSPIFILGMPRSGTTLVEQILGRHSQIEPAGELQIMQRLAEAARRTADNPDQYSGLLRSMTSEDFAILGKRYVSASSDYRRSRKPHFIDKNNLNWMHVGLVLLALPNAKVIDVRRNAVDCCWANFKMLFADTFPAANDLRHVGRFYRDYVRLIDYLADALPGRILRVRYEDVVGDIEGQTRRMLDHLELPFEADCLEFHRSTGAIATASSEQVRQPLNRRGIGSSDPYRPWLGPLLEELGPLADA